MTTTEEALDTGWLEPAPTFFGEDAQVYFSKCHNSPWVLIRRTEPKAIPLSEDLPEGRLPALVAAGMVERDPDTAQLMLKPRPRALTYMYAGPLGPDLGPWL